MSKALKTNTFDLDLNEYEELLRDANYGLKNLGDNYFLAEVLKSPLNLDVKLQEHKNGTAFIANLFQEDIDLPTVVAHAMDSFYVNNPIKWPTKEKEHEQFSYPNFFDQNNALVNQRRVEKAPKVTKVEHFEVLKKFECAVTNIDLENREFTAKVKSLDLSDRQDYEADFDIDEVSDDDLDLLKIGSVFYWHIGRYRNAQGTKSNVSEITFRRLPTWSKSRISKIGAIVDKLKSILE